MSRFTSFEREYRPTDGEREPRRPERSSESRSRTSSSLVHPGHSESLSTNVRSWIATLRRRPDQYECSGPRAIMSIGMVMVFAILAVGFGIVVFTGSATSGGMIWDLGFLLSLLAFLASFVRVIWRHAAGEVQPPAELSSDDDSDPA